MSNQKLSRRKIQYLLEHYERHGDGKLAMALGVDKEVIHRELKSRGLKRTDEQREWIHANQNEVLPPYTGQIPTPKNSVLLWPGHIVLSVVVAATALGIYLLTLPPTVTGEDSGELIAAAYTLGIPHPPGYPLWCLLGKLFTFVPWGTVAWRVSFMSAFWGAATAAAVYLIAAKLTRKMAGAAIGALAFALSREFWEQSVIAEVYTLNSFLIALCVLFLFLWYEHRNRAYLYALGVAYGLGLCNHHTMAMLGPLFAAFIVAVDREFWRRCPLYTSVVALAAAMLLIYVYLPLRAAANPPVNWGNPVDWRGFWDVVTRKQYQFGFVENPRTLDRMAGQLGTLARLYFVEFTPWLALAPVLGFAALWKLHRGGALFLGAMLFYVVFGFVFALNFDLDAESIWVNNVFFLPVYMIAGIALAAAVAWPLSILRSRAAAYGYTAAAAAICIGLPLSSNYRFCDKSNYYFAYDFGMNVLATLENNAIYFPAADHATFPALYLQAVEGMRPDVLMADKYGYPEKSVCDTIPADVVSPARSIPSEREVGLIEDWVIANSGRPVYFSKRKSLENLPGYRIENAGVLYRVVPQSAPADERDYWSEYAWHTLEPADTRGELTAGYILSDYYFSQGKDLLQKGNADQGLAQMQRAAEIGGNNKESLNNLASACAEAGQFDAAEEYYLRALEIDATYELALRNLGKMRMQKMRFDEALAFWERILEKKSGDPEAHWMIVRCLQELHRPDDALALLQKMGAAQPNDARVFREMGLIYLNNKQDLTAAQEMLSLSIDKDPDQPELVAMLSGLRLSGQSDLSPGHPQPQLPDLPSPPDQWQSIPDTGG